ncbi:MAG: hypothetical protein JWO82_4139 [Akkermansiaceae bacterium]|nr:hypothetical protein [Akkermansiaceae bacterium]
MIHWLALTPLLLLASCGPVSRGFDAGWTERAAQDRIMLVRDQPETLGHRRLVHQSIDHPDLRMFLGMKGQPDFIAETSSEQRQYLILYYLKGRHAFAGRSKRIPGAGMEFAGPYPMTPREAKLLGQFKSQAGLP